ncbi:MAG TPA: CZB domain-containing protein [Candidatus Solibacter sp.]|nr:CZB domain-containing protein [Candidatus Solibacter sp.]
MDFDQAIAAHGAWKHKLSDYLTKHDGSLKASEVGLDSKCPLGQWIHGEGIKFSKMPEYGTLKTEHARFHKAAAEVIKHADSGKSTTEDMTLGSKSEFGNASSAVVTAIMAMKKHAH